MLITFKSCRGRDSDPIHEHKFIPLLPIDTTYVYGDPGRPAEWQADGRVVGKVEEVDLEGCYTVEFLFEDAELENWLKRYVTEKPEEALRLLARMQAEASIQLARKGS